jgi:hypothetical protein
LTLTKNKCNCVKETKFRKNEIGVKMPENNMPVPVSKVHSGENTKHWIEFDAISLIDFQEHHVWENNLIVATYLSVMKWHPYNLKKGRGKCGLCEHRKLAVIASSTYISDQRVCAECPLALYWGLDCNSFSLNGVPTKHKSLWERWTDSIDPYEREELAEAIFIDLVKVYEALKEANDGTT